MKLEKGEIRCRWKESGCALDSPSGSLNFPYKRKTGKPEAQTPQSGDEPRHKNSAVTKNGNKAHPWNNARIILLAQLWNEASARVGVVYFLVVAVSQLLVFLGIMRLGKPNCTSRVGNGVGGDGHHAARQTLTGWRLPKNPERWPYFRTSA